MGDSKACRGWISRLDHTITGQSRARCGGHLVSEEPLCVCCVEDSTLSSIAVEQELGAYTPSHKCLAGLPRACKDITLLRKSGPPWGIRRRALFAPALLGRCLPPEESCMHRAQWSLAPVKPIYLLNASRADMHWLAVVAGPTCTAHSLLGAIYEHLLSSGMVARGANGQGSSVLALKCSVAPATAALPVCIAHHQITDGQLVVPARKGSSHT